MFDNFFSYLSNYQNFTEADFAKIEHYLSIQKLKRKELFLRENEVCIHLSFVCKGILRSYHTDAKGNEHVIQFAPENHWTGNRESLQTGFPSKFAIDAIEPTEVILIKAEDYRFLESEIPALAAFTSQVTKRNILALEERIYRSISLTAEEKYQNFLKKFPTLSQRVPQHMIASYIGITPETLSRIKRNLIGK